MEEEIVSLSLQERIKRRFAKTLLPESFSHVEQLQEENRDLVMRLGRAKSRLDKDVSLMKASPWTNLLIGDYNPDEIGLDEYNRMFKYDSQVRAGYDLISMGVLMKPWRIRHPDKEVVDTLTMALSRMKQPTIRNAMKQMLTALVFGFSVTEIVFATYKSYWMPRQLNGLKTVDPQYIRFFSDQYGFLEKIEQRVATGSITAGVYPLLPLDRTLVWSHDKRFGNWYGESLLGACYKNWFIKDAMLKFANIAYERFGAPVYLGIAANLKDMENIQAGIEHLYAYSQATIVKRGPEDPADITILESTRTEMPFDRYIRYQDEMILRRMLIGQKLFEGGGGTYGPKIPFDIILMRFEDFRLELVEIMNELLLITTDLNWDLSVLPKFEFAPLTTSDVATLRTSIFEALDRKILELPVDQEWIRQEMGFPQIQKKREFGLALHGRYLPDPYASWLASGTKKIIVGTSPYNKYPDQEIYLVGDGGIYAIMKEGHPAGPFTEIIRDKYYLLHKLSEDDWSTRFGKKTQFWVWQPEIIKKFETPLKYSVPEGVSTYLRRVVPEVDPKVEVDEH